MTAELSTRERVEQPAAEERGPARTGALQRVRRAPDWLLSIGAGVAVAVLAVIPQWRGNFFYSSPFVGDQYEQFAPMWHMFGDLLRSGHWPMMDPADWQGGNYAAEAVTGMWNPVNLVNYLLVSTFDNLNLAAFVVAVEFLALLAMGTYLLAREYTAGRLPAVLVATALPFGGFTLFYEAAGWSSGLFALTWVTHFWWSTRRFSRGRLTPVIPFLFGALAVTTGNPYGTLGVIVVLAAVAVELLVARRHGRLLHLAVMGLCVGALTLLVFLPLLGIGSVSLRSDLAAIANDAFLVPRLGDLVSSSSPTYTPAIQVWTGPVQVVPATYFAWFAVPLLPWLRWRAAWAVLRRGQLSLFLIVGFYALTAFGPSNLWLFRWPLRLIESFWLSVAVLYAVVLSRGLATDRIRGRAVATGVLVLVGGYLSWAARPTDFRTAHVIGVLLVAALVAGAVVAYRRIGMRGLVAVGLVGTALVLVLQSTAFPVNRANAVNPPYDLSRIASTTATYRGAVLQLAALPGVTTQQKQDGVFLFGNLPQALDEEWVNSYTGQGFRAFDARLCMDYRAATCPQAFDQLWQPAGPGFDVPLVDAMRLSTLVMQRSLIPSADGVPPAGWHVAVRDADRAVWVRDHPLPTDRRVSWASAGVTVLGDTSDFQREEVRYQADAPGKVLFARLGWPGYTATVDGRPVTASPGPAGLLTVDVPSGAHTLVVDYVPPGRRLGILAAVVAVIVVLGQAVLWEWQRRRRRPREVL